MTRHDGRFRDTTASAKGRSARRLGPWCGRLARRSGFAFLSLIAPACGPNSHPTGPLRVTESRTGQVAAHWWACAIEFLALDGGVTARLTPGSLNLELRVGSCSAPGSVLGSTATGLLTLTLTEPTGGYHLRVGNPGDSAVEYRVEVQFSTPSL